MSNMDALMFALTLEVVLLQMRVLEGCSEWRTQQWMTSNLTGKLQCEKLARDRQTIHDVTRRTLIELSETGEWGTLQEAVAILRQRGSSASRKRQHYEELKRSCQQVSEELSIKKTDCQIQLRSVDQYIALLKDKMNDDKLNASARLCYTDKWLLARAESQELESEVKIDMSATKRIEYEHRVHAELVKAYELQVMERGDCLKYWHQRYSVDTTKINQDLTKLCDLLRVVDKRRTELQNLYDLHAGEIRGWLTFKRERAARLERESRWRASATRIQSWWRGVMVRRALGTFKFLKTVKKSVAKTKKK